MSDGTKYGLSFCTFLAESLCKQAESITMYGNQSAQEIIANWPSETYKTY
jgi:hypothetical protein